MVINSLLLSAVKLEEESKAEDVDASESGGVVSFRLTGVGLIGGGIFDLEVGDVLLSPARISLMVFESCSRELASKRVGFSPLELVLPEPAELAREENVDTSLMLRLLS